MPSNGMSRTFLKGVFDLRISPTEVVTPRGNPFGKKRCFFIPKRANKPMYILDAGVLNGPAYVQIGVIWVNVRRDNHLVTHCSSANVSENVTSVEEGKGNCRIPFLLIESRHATAEQVANRIEKRGNIPKMFLGYRSFFTETSPYVNISKEEMRSMQVLAELHASSVEKNSHIGYILIEGDNPPRMKYVVHDDRMGDIDIVDKNGNITEKFIGHPVSEGGEK